MLVLLVIALTLPKMDKPILYQEPMESIEACNSAVREMTYRAPAELKEGGQFEASCVIKVPKSENP